MDSLERGSPSKTLPATLRNQEAGLGLRRGTTLRPISSEAEKEGIVRNEKGQAG